MLRKATLRDAKKIHSLISLWAKKRVVMERSLNYIYENIRDYWVFKEKNSLLGVCALHVIGWGDLGEIKSLVVGKEYQKKGIARNLVEACLSEAKSLDLKQVFALTFVPLFFLKIGFKKTNMDKLPHKIWNECVNCVFFPNCEEEAVILTLKSK